MPVYAFKGYNQKGKAVEGSKEAESLRVLKFQLRKEGIFPTEIKETSGRKKFESKGGVSFSFFAPKVSSQDLAMATRQLATLVSSGIPLAEALSALVDQIDDKNFKTIWGGVRQRVNEGTSFADALREHAKTFSPLYINMVRAGESSGALDIVLNRLADFTESQAELKGKLIGTMVYPVVMFCMAILVTAMLFVVVIPKIAIVFESQHMELPLPTQILVLISYLTANYWWLALLLIGGGIFFLRRWINTSTGKMKWHTWLLKIPIFGSLIRMLAISRFCKTLATLLGSGVQLLTAFDIVKNVVQNVVLLEVIEKARDSVKEGESIAAPLKRSGHFPPIVTHMISIGEKSGQLEKMLENVSMSYDVQIEAKLRAMTSLIEPLIIVIMGGVVASIVFAILMPMLQMSASI